MARMIFGAVAIFNILAALIFIGCGVCANVTDGGGTWNVDINGKRVADEKMLQAHLRKDVPAYPAVKITLIVLGYSACVGLILSGIALFFGKWWGKLLAAPVYALGFLHHVAFIVYLLVWVHPAIESFFNQIPRPQLFGPPIVGDGIDFIITTQSYAARWPGYVSIAWLIAGCLYYLVATPVVLFTPTASGDDDADETPISKSRRRDDDDEDDDDDDNDKPRSKSGKGRSEGRTRSGRPPR